MKKTKIEPTIETLESRVAEGSLLKRNAFLQHVAEAIGDYKIKKERWEKVAAAYQSTYCPNLPIKLVLEHLETGSYVYYDYKFMLDLSRGRVIVYGDSLENIKATRKDLHKQDWVFI